MIVTINGVVATRSEKLFSSSRLERTLACAHYDKEKAASCSIDSAILACGSILRSANGV